MFVIHILKKKKKKDSNVHDATLISLLTTWSELKWWTTSFNAKQGQIAYLCLHASIPADRSEFGLGWVMLGCDIRFAH
jgi:hypothetical protein